MRVLKNDNQARVVCSNSIVNPLLPKGSEI